MVEQRFTYKQHYNAPLMIGEAFDGNKKLTVQEMVDLLNELSKENEQLKEKVIILEKLISDVETSEGMSIDNLIDTEMIGDE